MLYFSLNTISAADLRAIYGYIRFLGPAVAPAFVLPGKEPP